MNELLATRSKLVVLDTSDIIERCWDLFGRVEGSGYRPHQRNFFTRKVLKLTSGAFVLMSTKVDPNETMFIHRAFNERRIKNICNSILETYEDEVLVNTLEYIMQRLVKLLVSMGLSTLDLRNMTFVQWVDDDMLVRLRYVR